MIEAITMHVQDWAGVLDGGLGLQGRPRATQKLQPRLPRSQSAPRELFAPAGLWFLAPPKGSSHHAR